MVLGAAQGLGEAFARQLARQGMDLVLVDVQHQKLLDCAAVIRSNYDVDVRALTIDLAEKTAVGQLMAAITENKECRLLVYCAAYGPVRMFLDNEPADLDRHIDVNTRNLLHLSHAFSHHLIERRLRGGMVFISSFAGLWGTTLVAPYGATKAFDWNLGEALHYELKTYGIDVLAVCCGAMSTPNYVATEPQYGWLRPKVDDPFWVAGRALRQLGRKALYIPGWNNQLTTFLLGRLLPRSWSARIFNDTMRRMYRTRWRPGKCE